MQIVSIVYSDVEQVGAAALRPHLHTTLPQSTAAKLWLPLCSLLSSYSEIAPPAMAM